MDWNDILLCRGILQRLEDFVAWPHPHDRTVGEDRQPVGASQDSRTMGDDHDRRAVQLCRTDRPRQRFLAVAVERRVGLVENQDTRAAIKRARQRYALRLPRRQPVAITFDRGVVTAGQMQDHLVDAGHARSNHDLLVNLRLWNAARDSEA